MTPSPAILALDACLRSVWAELRELGLSPDAAREAIREHAGDQAWECAREEGLL